MINKFIILKLIYTFFLSSNACYTKLWKKSDESLLVLHPNQLSCPIHYEDNLTFNLSLDDPYEFAFIVLEQLKQKTKEKNNNFNDMIIIEAAEVTEKLSEFKLHIDICNSNAFNLLNLQNIFVFFCDERLMNEKYSIYSSSFNYLTKKDMFALNAILNNLRVNIVCKLIYEKLQIDNESYENISTKKRDQVQGFLRDLSELSLKISREGVNSDFTRGLKKVIRKLNYIETEVNPNSTSFQVYGVYH